MARFYTEKDGHVYVVTSTGWKVECMPVGDLLMQVGTGLEDPEEPHPPTYTITDVSGETEERPHDEDSIADPTTSKEEKEAWEEYVIKQEAYNAALQIVTRRRNEQKARFIALRGMKVVSPPIPDLDEWAEEQRDLYGLPVPERGKDLLLAFLHNEVVRTEDDGIKISAGIFRASGLDEEVMDQIEATFLGSLGRSNGSNPETDQGEAETEESET